MVRNACRQWMTRDQAEISESEQLAWWSAEPRRLWLFENACYGLLVPEGGKTWVSLGCLPEARGKGLGTQMYEFLAQQEETVWAEIWGYNAASIIAALKAGYVFDGLVVCHS